MTKKNNSLIIISIIISLITIVFLTTINYLSIKKQEYNNNLIISNIIQIVKEQNPNIEESQIIELLNQEKLNNQETLKSYSIYLEDSYIKENQTIIKNTIITNIIILSISSSIIVILLIINNQHNKKNIQKLTSYLKELNNHNYNLDLKQNNEGELSILKNEIYKTAIILNEQSLNDKKAKESLKNSLEDISHQLKTPLTSINLMIDNLQNDKLTSKERKELLTKINRKINNINFLVSSLLKLSKFDANTITFNRKYVSLEHLTNEVKENLSALSDLKNINIIINGNKKDKLYCDNIWQTEALTNIVKNCLEHSNPNSVIEISYLTNDIFTKIVIKDNGVGISKKDLPHIFERFYKGDSSSKDSIGIGLSLAKTIIEKDNGNIQVSSTINKGTTFTIKYFK